MAAIFKRETKSYYTGMVGQRTSPRRSACFSWGCTLPTAT